MRTKRDEFEILNRWKIEAKEEHDSYLAQLMTDAFVQWVGDRITFDQSPDILDALEANERNVVAANERYCKALHEIEELKEGREKILGDLQRAEQMVTHRDEIIRGFPQTEDIEGAKREIDRLREENIKLKARLFDALEM